MTMIILAVTIFLGFQLFTGGNKGQADDYRDPQAVFDDLRKAYSETVNPRASDEFIKQKAVFEKDVLAKKITQAQADAQLRALEVSISTKADSRATADYGLLKPRVEQAVTNNKLSKEAAGKMLGEGVILSHGANFQHAVATKDTGKVQATWQQLEVLHRSEEKLPSWSASYDVPAPQGTGTVSKSMKVLYDEVSTDLALRNKTDLVWGFLPGYKIIDSLVALTGRVPGFSYAFASFLLALLVRAIIWVPMMKQLKWGKQMQQLAPLAKEIKDEYEKKDPTGYRTNPEVQQKTMALYKEYGISPVAGCLPMLIQLPFFWAIFSCMLHYRFEFTKGTFLWINPNSSDLFAKNLGSTDNLLVVLYGISMLISQFLTPISDPAQAKQTRMMGIFVSIMVSVMMFFYPLPSAFVLYWVFLNIFATAQSLYAYRQPLPPLQKVNGPNGTVFPMNGLGNGSGGGTQEPMSVSDMFKNMFKKPGTSDNSKSNGHSEGLFKGTGKPSTQQPKKKKK